MKKFFKSAAFAAVVCSSLLAAGCAEETQSVGIVAHRGFWNCEEAGYARNSVAALKCAQEAGFWGSEFDLNMTSDEVLLVFHDDKINGLPIDQNPYETFKDIKLENGEYIPTLDQYLEQAAKHPETVLVFELKCRSSKELEDRMTDLAVAKLKEYGIDTPDKVIFISFSINICERLAATMPGFTVQYLGSNFSPDQLAEKGINGIDFHYGLFGKNPEWMQQARNNKMSVNCWTVNDTTVMKSMAELGVDYITSDNPLDVRKVLEDLGIKEK